MGTTIIETLFEEGDVPTGEFIRLGGILDTQGKTRALRGTGDGTVFVTPGGTARDSFSRFRVSVPHGIYDSKQLYVKDEVLMIESLSGGATSVYSANDSSVTMTVPTTSGATAIRQSKINIPYQPGRGVLALMTGVMGAPKANVRQRWGLFDGNDGLFWEQTISGLRAVRRTSTSGSPVDNAIEQASWNLDTLDGNGPSGITLDPSKINLYIIDFAWLGVGEARLGIEVDGVIIYCHAFQTANTISTVFTKTPALPIRYEIANTGTSADSTSMLQTCCAAFSEGGFDPLGFPVIASNGTTTRSVSIGSSVPVVSVRLRSGFTKGILVPRNLSILCENKESLHFSVVMGGTVSGGAWSNVGLGSEVNTTGTSISGGTVIDAGYLSSTGSAGSLTVITRTPLVATGNAFTGTADPVSLVISPITTNLTIAAALQMHEVL